MARYGSVKTQMKEIAATAAQQPEEIRERRSGAEDVLGALNAEIGKAGTYDLPGPNAPSPVADPDAEADGLSIFKSQHTKVGVAATGGKGGTDTTVLDKDAALAQMKSSSAFRQVSRMMAESEQMLARSGPLYDEMMRSSQLPIIEGSATLARENTEAIRKALQRGGAARRDGFAAIAKIRAQEQANAARGQALAKAHTEMDRWVRQNASEVMTFANGWATNQAGIRESYHSAMDSATQLMAQASLPTIFNASIKEQEYRDAQSAQSRGKVMRQISGVLGVATSIVGLVGSFYGQGGGSTAGAKMMADSTASQPISNNYMGATAPGSGGTAAPRTLGGDLKAFGSKIGDAASSAGSYITGGW